MGFEKVQTTWNTAWHMPAYTRDAPQAIINLLCLALPIAFLGVDGKYGYDFMVCGFSLMIVVIILLPYDEDFSSYIATKRSVFF